MTGEVKLFVDKTEKLTSTECRIISNGLKNTYGEEIAVDKVESLLSANEGEIYDISILSITQMKDGKVIYQTPDDGCSTVLVDVVNTAFKQKTATVICFAADENGNEKEIIRENITLEGDERVLLSYNLTTERNEKIFVRLEK